MSLLLENPWGRKDEHNRSEVWCPRLCKSLLIVFDFGEHAHEGSEISI